MKQAITNHLTSPPAVKFNFRTWQEEIELLPQEKISRNAREVRSQLSDILKFLEIPFFSSSLDAMTHQPESKPEECPVEDRPLLEERLSVPKQKGRFFPPLVPSSSSFLFGRVSPTKGGKTAELLGHIGMVRAIPVGWQNSRKGDALLGCLLWVAGKQKGSMMVFFWNSCCE